jgi:hypothetical protein
MSDINLAALKSMLDESISKAVTPLHEEIGALRERVRAAEESSHHADSESSSGSEASVESDGILGNEESYLQIDPHSNHHYGAADLAHTGEFKPHRHDLYGHRPYMVLSGC